MATQREVLVYAHWKGLTDPMLMGTLNVTPSRGKEIFSFEYTKEWLKSDQVHILDPDLQFYSGPHICRKKKITLEFFLTPPLTAGEDC